MLGAHPVWKPSGFIFGYDSYRRFFFAMAIMKEFRKIRNATYHYVN